MKRFRIAFSFAGETIDFVAKVAAILAERFGESSILYHKYHEAEFARARLGRYLPKLYHEETDLVVVVICQDYAEKEWPGLEWDAVFDLLKKRKEAEVMLCRFDQATIEGLFSDAGYIELDNKTPDQAATLILQRLALNEGKPKDHYTSKRPTVSQTERGGLQTSSILTKLRSKQGLALSLGLLVVVVAAIFVLAAIYRNRIGQYSAQTPPPPPFQLTSTDVKDTFKPAANIPFWRYRQDFGDVDALDKNGVRKLAWTGVGVSRTRGAVDQAFGRLKESGVKVVVWFLFADGAAAPDFDQEGFVTGLDQSFVNDYKAAVELAEKNDISIIWVLIDHKWMEPKAIGSNSAVLNGHADIIENPQKRQTFFEKALKPLLLMYPDHKHIAGWVVINEPEVALENGYVSEEKLTGFIREAAQIIRENTRLQPVSIGHLDLESLLKHHQDHNVIELDFYVFHHYKAHLPPSVAHIRTLMRNETNKPIYIGEFSLNEPSKPRPVSDLRHFVSWSRMLGYAGIWPWALKPLENEPEKFQDINEISRLIEECRESPSALDEEERRALLEHMRRGVETVNLQLNEWKSGIARHNNEIRRNQREFERTATQLAHEKTEEERELQVFATASGVHSQNLNALKECQNDIATMLKLPHNPADLAKLRDNERDLSKRTRQSEQWARSASEDLARRRREIDNQEQWLRDYERKVRLNEYQSRMKAFKINLAGPLYLDYWRAQLAQGSISR
jgi:hypothetical protein